MLFSFVAFLEQVTFVTFHCYSSDATHFNRCTLFLCCRRIENLTATFYRFSRLVFFFLLFPARIYVYVERGWWKVACFSMRDRWESFVINFDCEVCANAFIFENVSSRIRGISHNTYVAPAVVNLFLGCHIAFVINSQPVGISLAVWKSRKRCYYVYSTWKFR